MLPHPHWKLSGFILHYSVCYATQTVANEMWHHLHLDDSTVMVTVVMPSHYTLVYYNLYVNYIYLI
jgi:hypothetical protein